MAKPRCNIHRTTILEPIPGQPGYYRCPLRATCLVNKVHVSNDGPASSDPERNYEMTTERQSLK